MNNKQQLFTQLYLTVAQDVERFALHLTRNRQEAKEIISVVLAATWENFDRVKAHDAFKSYLFTAVRREFYAQKKRNNRLDQIEDAHIEQLYSITPAPDARLELNDLYAALGQLGNEQREAIILAEIYGYSHKEIAEIQESSVANIKVRIHRAKHQLRILLGETPESETKNNESQELPSVIV